MDKSFRTILDEHLNPRAAAPSAAPRAFVIEDSWLDRVAWTADVGGAPARAYARETLAARENARRARRPQSEPVVARGLLGLEDLADIQALIDLGATELIEGLSVGRLKTAYRRLARRYHPDANVGGDLARCHDLFLDVRARHQRLSLRLRSF